MAWTAPTLRTTGELVTASIWNTDIVANLIELRAGGVAIASQAAADLVGASSATQLSRIAKGTALQYLRMNSGANGQEWASLGLTLLHEATGTSSAAGATNVDTYALASQLTIKDALVIFVRHRNSGSAANVLPVVYNSTDSVTIANLSQANNNYYTDTVIIGAQSTTRIGGTLINFGTAALGTTRSTFATSYAGAWTIALRHGGVTAPDTWEWEWAILKFGGQ